MSTPLKSTSLLTSSILSPRSPLLLSSPLRRHGHLRKLTPVTLVRSNTARCLEFTKSSTNMGVLLKDYQSGYVEGEGVKITVNDKSIGDGEQPNNLFINTPIKQQLVRNGLSSNRTFNILGKGTFATVVKSVYKNRLVAAKIVKLRHINSGINDVNAISLSHKNVVGILEITTNQMEKFGVILMEYHEGSRQLQTLLDDTTIELNMEDIRHFALDICTGLEYCHNRGVLHLDLKPKNILVCDGICKICDFGNSVNIHKVDENYTYQGTILYAAPELLLGKMPTTKCDIYSLGILFWQLKYRQYPYFDLQDSEVIIYKVVKHQLRPHSVPEDDDCFGKLFEDCWQSDPAKRLDVEEILKILEEI